MATPTVIPGEPAPPFTLTALGSGRSISPGSNGYALLLVFHDQNTVNQVQTMQADVRTRYGNARQLQIASVVNMQSIPIFLRPVAETVMKGSYTKAAAAMPSGLDAADYVVILLDWDGSVSQSYGAVKIDRQPRLVLIDAAGTVSAVHQDVEISAAALAMVERLLGPPAA